MDTLWKDIPNFEDYAVSPDGRIASRLRDLILQPSQNREGILYVRLRSDGRQFSRAIAPIVAEAFLEPHRNPRCDTPMHRDGDKTNCAVDNLVWRPRWYVIEYHKQFVPGGRSVHQDRREVYCYDTDELFPSLWDAAVAHGVVNNKLFSGIMNGDGIFPDYRKYEFIEDDEVI